MGKQKFVFMPFPGPAETGKKTYNGVSFFSLTPHGQTGLAALLLAPGIGLILVVYRLRPHWTLHTLAANFALWLFVLLSPQVCYAC